MSYKSHSNNYAMPNKLTSNDHSLALRNVQKSLDTILQEYRSGRREPTVVSQALIDKSLVQKEQLLEQIASDLEDKDVHPDAFLLNSDYISSWLSEIMEMGGLEEGVLPAEASNIVNEDMTTSEWLSEGAEVFLIPGHEPVFSKIGINNGSPSTFAVDEVPVSNSRPSSALSHRSKPDYWHPSNRPDPSYVLKMLSSLFDTDFASKPAADQSRIRIMRAFNQRDWLHRGFLDRPEVFQVCSETLKKAGINGDYDDFLRDRVRKYDSDRDGQIDRQEFIELINDLIDHFAKLREQDCNEELRKCGSEAQSTAMKRRSMQSDRRVLPWKWARTSEYGNKPYLDTITSLDHERAPLQRMELYSFTAMALEAEVAIGTVGDFQQTWLGIVPQSLQSTFTSCFEQIRQCALAFTEFESRNDEGNLSDLDVALICFEISMKSPSFEAKYAWNRTSVERLQAARKLALNLLALIQGVCSKLRLPSFSGTSIKTEVHDFPQFHEQWKNEKVALLARQMQIIFMDEHTGWPIVKAAIADVREKELPAHLEPAALAVVGDFTEDSELQLKQLRAKTWQGSVHELHVNMPKMSSSRLSSLSKTWNKGRSSCNHLVSCLHVRSSVRSCNDSHRQTTPNLKC